MNILECITGKTQFGIADATALLEERLYKIYDSEYDSEKTKHDKNDICMLETFTDFSKAHTKQTAICVDIGGTNIRTAKISFDSSGKAEIQNHIAQRLPKRIRTFDQLMEEMAKQIICADGPGKTIPAIRICFSYPFESLEDHDAKVLFLSKDTGISGAEGKLIGESLRKYLGDCCKSAIGVVNDTVTTLVYSKYALPDADFNSSLAYGVVMGTGTNIALCKNGKQIINTEIGQMPIPFRNPNGIESNMVFEHITGGKYIAETIKTAFSDDCETSAALSDVKTAEDLGKIATSGLPESKTVLQAIERCAKIEAVILSAVIAYQKNIEGKSKAIISAGGSIYEKLPHFKESFDNEIKRIACESGYEVEISTAGENSNLIAAAMCGFPSEPASESNAQ